LNLFFRVMIGGLKTAQRAAGNRRLRIHLRRAALNLERQVHHPSLY
jgi:hypothetical protein